MERPWDPTHTMDSAGRRWHTAPWGQGGVGEIREMQEGECDWRKESKERVGRGCSSQDCLDSIPMWWEAMGMFEHRQ